MYGDFNGLGCDVFTNSSVDIDPKNSQASSSWLWGHNLGKWPSIRWTYYIYWILIHLLKNFIFSRLCQNFRYMIACAHCPWSSSPGLERGDSRYEGHRAEGHTKGPTKKDDSRINPLQTGWNYLSAIEKSWKTIFPPFDHLLMLNTRCHYCHHISLHFIFGVRIVRLPSWWLPTICWAFLSHGWWHGHVTWVLWA